MLLILVGKSGCGKSTIEKNFEKMISFTTREPREGENHGKDYYFYERDVVEKEIQNFKENKPTFIKQLSSYGGEYYGTSEEEVERIKNSKNNVVAVMNIEGAKDMKEIMENQEVKTKIVWIEIDEELRVGRMAARMKETGETKEQIEKRLNEDYRNKEKEEVDVIIENNGSLEEVLKKINDVI